MSTSNPVHAEASDAVIKVTRAANRLSLRFSERKLLLASGDVFLLNAALIGTLGMHSGLRPSLQSFAIRWPWFISLTILWFMCALTLECYNLSRAASIQRSLRRISGAAILTSGAYPLIPYVTPSLPNSRLIIFAFPVLALVSIVTWRIIYATVFVRPGFQQRALIVGPGRAGHTLVQTIGEISHSNGRFHQNIGYQITGFIDEDATKQRTTIEGAPIVGTPKELVRLVRQLSVDELIVADDLVGAITDSEIIPGQPQRRRSDALHGELFTAILECHEMGVSITTTATLYERLTGRVPVEHIGRALNMALPLGQPATHRFYLMLRRIFDIGISLVGCILLVAIIPLVWLANRCTSPGPLFYRQERVGKAGHRFSLVKFRSMVVDAERDIGTVWASENDPRITPVGRLLRKTRLDEIPQFWNILRGDMSLIGPRPERPYFVNQLATQIPFYRARHAVKPGLTGWAQVKYRYGASLEDSLMKLQYDLYYIKHQSLLLDLKILLETIPVVLGFKGR
jgi:exopolysaccharide biosynthesis polyprenyl glycosylphosphotransferase